VHSPREASRIDVTEVDWQIELVENTPGEKPSPPSHCTLGSAPVVTVEARGWLLDHLGVLKTAFLSAVI
jgi:hypothetical protein